MSNCFPCCKLAIAAWLLTAVWDMIIHYCSAVARWRSMQIRFKFIWSVIVARDIHEFLSSLESKSASHYSSQEAKEKPKTLLTDKSVILSAGSYNVQRNSKRWRKNWSRTMFQTACSNSFFLANEVGLSDLRGFLNDVCFCSNVWNEMEETKMAETLSRLLSARGTCVNKQN